ncbi:protein of unknown function [Paenibacillus alvei]|uniref:Uncharacterized protein n=1 Tax=Paenibacillus alvei TaxID=44250 RepID=A0A383RBV6_PAEAL|nr:protein of unknown function [Paenibacillus alvei]
MFFVHAPFILHSLRGHLGRLDLQLVVRKDIVQITRGDEEFVTTSRKGSKEEYKNKKSATHFA